MSNEQFLAISAINPLTPNQFNPQNSGISWLEPFGAISQGADQSFSIGQLPILAINSFQPNISVLAVTPSQNTDVFTTFTNGFLANTSVTSWQFTSSAEDKAIAIGIDPLRQNIADSLQQPDLVGQPDSSLTQTIDLAQQQIASFFQQPDVAEQLALAFGQGVDPELAKSYSQQLPTIEIVPDSILGKANGAYAASTNTIFLAYSLIARGDQQEIVAVLLEEIGHSIDAHINTKDAAGDEGEILSGAENFSVLNYAYSSELDF
jgi:hypothetical protein